MEKLLDLHERQQREGARLEFNAALMAVQAAIEPVAKTHRNTETKSLFAKLEDVTRELKPLLMGNGFTYSSLAREGTQPDYMIVVLALAHSGGFEREYTMPGSQ